MPNGTVPFVTFQIVAHREGFAIIHHVGILRYPIAYYEQAAGVAQHEVELDMTVTEYEIVYVGMGFEILLGIDYLKLPILTQIFVNAFETVFFHAMLSPGLTKAHAPAGRQQ